jgi:2,5-diamino-6-(ribosylamino)-4(3H)-pyrimidinone 5'-phosphate reductase
MRPYVFVNVAMSADGKLSTRERRQVKISGAADFQRVDRIKAASDAIMVGIGTVLADDPSLTVKDPELKAARAARGEDENPIRVVVDSRGRTPIDAAILNKGSGQRIVAVSGEADEKNRELLRKKADVIATGTESVDLPALLDALHARGVRRLMVEGGGTLIWSLIKEDLVDEIQTFIGNMVIGGKDAPTLADGEGFLAAQGFVGLDLADVLRMEEGILLTWKVRRQQHSIP